MRLNTKKSNVIDLSQVKQQKLQISSISAKPRRAKRKKSLWRKFVLRCRIFFRNLK